MRFRQGFLTDHPSSLCHSSPSCFMDDRKASTSSSSPPSSSFCRVGTLAVLATPLGTKPKPAVAAGDLFDTLSISSLFILKAVGTMDVTFLSSVALGSWTTVAVALIVGPPFGTGGATRGGGSLFPLGTTTT